MWLTLKEAEIRRGDWMDPDAGKVAFGAYAASWINDQVLKPRTDGLYRGLLKNHLAAFGNVDIGDIREGDVRAGGRNASMLGGARLGRSGRLPSPRHTGCCTRS